jgi:hypothetical protein
MQSSSISAASDFFNAALPGALLISRREQLAYRLVDQGMGLSDVGAGIGFPLFLAIDRATFSMTTVAAAVAAAPSAVLATAAAALAAFPIMPFAIAAPISVISLYSNECGTYLLDAHANDRPVCF